MPLVVQCPQCAASRPAIERALHPQHLPCHRCGATIVVAGLPTVCDFCKATGPTTHAHFHHHVAIFKGMEHTHYEGNMCPACVDRIFNECQRITKTHGWWGVTQFFATAILLKSNRSAAQAAWCDLRRRVRQTNELGDATDQILARWPTAINPAESRLIVPAIGLILSASLGFLLAFAGFALFSAVTPESSWQTEVKLRRDQIARTRPGDQPPPALNPEPTAADLADMTWKNRCWMGFACLEGLTAPLIIFGAVQMLRVRMYIPCVLGCAVAILPLANPCCLLTMLFGIWGLVVLCFQDVRDAFP